MKRAEYQAQLDEALRDPVIKSIHDGLPELITQYVHEKREHDLQVQNCRDFIDDKQHQYIRNGFIRRSTPDPDEAEFTGNFIRRIHQIFIAELIKNRPTMVVSPGGADDPRIAISDIASQVAQQYAEQFSKELLLLRAFNARQIDGVAFLAPEFYPNAGRPGGVHPDTGQVWFEGRVGARLIPSFDIIAPDNYEYANHLPMMGNVVRMNKKIMQKRWDLESEPATDKRINIDSERFQTYFGTDKHHENDSELFVCYFMSGNGELPADEKYGNGIGFVIQGEQVIQFLPEFPAPFNDPEFKHYPFIDLHWCRVPGKYWSKSLVSPLVGPQMAFNQMIENAMQNANFAGNPVWRVLKGQFSSKNDIPNYAGGVMFYNYIPHAAPPDMAAPPSMPQYIQQFPTQLQGIGFDIWNASQIAQAAQPGSVNSYAGMNLLHEVYQKLLTPGLAEVESPLSVFFTAVLMLHQRYTNRLTPIITDEAGDEAIHYYTGADLPKSYTIRVNLGTGEETTAMRNQRLMQERQLNIIGDEQYRKGVYGIEEQSAVKLARREALAENARMLEGQLEPNDDIWHLTHDDHAAHFEINAKIKKSPQYSQWPDEWKRVLDYHIGIHWMGINDPQRLIQEKLTPQFEALGVVKPQPPGMAQPIGGAPPPAPTGKPAQIVPEQQAQPQGA